MTDDILKMSVDRGFTWMEDETLALIKIWSAKDVQHELNTAKRNFTVYERIAKELANVGYSRTAYQCREKIKRLRKEYQAAYSSIINNVNQKKPMKYYELVHEVFNQTTNLQNECDSMKLSESCFSDGDENESQFSFIPDRVEENLSGSTSNLEGEKNLNLKSESVNDSNDSVETLLTNNKDDDFQDEVVLDKDDALDESISPWVPNVVLVENDDDDENKVFNFSCHSSETEVEQEKSGLYKRIKTHKKPYSSDNDEPLHKKKKVQKNEDARANWFSSLMDQVTEKFLSYQEIAENQLLERIVLIEQERIKKDEAMQKMWIEFEERRRKEEQQHELKMLNLFSEVLDHLP